MVILFTKVAQTVIAERFTHTFFDNDGNRVRKVFVLPLAEDRELTLLSTEPRALIFHTSLLLPKATRSTQGVAVMTLKPKYQLQRVCTPEESGIVNLPRYRARSIPGTGALLRPEDRDEEQLTLL